MPQVDLRSTIVERIAASPQITRVASELSTAPGFYSTFLSVLCDVELPEEQAKGLWNRARQRRIELEADLHRSVDARLALLDVLIGEAPFVRNPKIADIAKDEQRRRDAFVDEVTGLYNRRYAHASIEREISRSHRHSLVFALLFVDLDGFKAINDTLGHATGDEVLRAFGMRMRAMLRAEDTVARYGGDEFLVIMPRTDASGAYQFARRLLDSVSEISREVGGRVGFSAGVAVYPADGKSAAALVDSADKRLYGAKGSGKGRVFVETPSDQRRHDRYPASLLVEFDAEGGKPICGSARNLSCGGISIETTEKLDVGRHVRLRIYSTAEGRTYQVTSQIIWLRELPGNRVFRLGASYANEDESTMQRLLSQVRQNHSA